MNNNLFLIDPMAAVNYGLYNSVKGEEGSYLDFLLKYDSKGANENDNSWLTDLVGEDTIANISSPEVLSSLNLAGISTSDLLSQKNYFDMQVDVYKLQLTTEMEKRGIEVPENLGVDTYSLFGL